jgi:proton glutamate symport protein
MMWYRRLHWQILIGMGAGSVVGSLIGDNVRYVEPVGEIFLRLLRMVIVPLIFSSLVVGVSGLGDASSVGRMGMKALLYYTATSIVAILTGLLAVNLIHPGVGAQLPLVAAPEGIDTSASQLGETLINIVPPNPVTAMAEGNILSIIFFSLVFGLFATRLREPARGTIIGFVQALFDLMMLITEFIIRLAPIGVFALMASLIGNAGFDAFPPLLRFMVTVVLSLGVHALITLPLVLLFFARLSPPSYARAVAPALATAFSTASSSATLPVTLESVERRGGIANQVSSFVLPLGATVNMDGTALYECVAVMFIAQVYGISLNAGQQIIVVLTALLASIGAAGIPMAGLVMMAIVLRAVGLPLEGVGLILAVDRILDMCRTSVNVWSDTVGAAVIARWERYPIERTMGSQPD